MRALATILAAVPLSGVVLPAQAGWHAGRVAPHACPGVSPSRCSSVESWAATTRWLDCAGCIPQRTLRSFGANGIAIQVMVARERRLAWERRLSWPPRITSGAVRSGLEGTPTDVGVYQTIGRIGGMTVSIYVFFGRAHPSAAQLRRASAELAGARTPASWR